MVATREIKLNAAGLVLGNPVLSPTDLTPEESRDIILGSLSTRYIRFPDPDVLKSVKRLLEDESDWMHGPNLIRIVDSSRIKIMNDIPHAPSSTYVLLDTSEPFRNLFPESAKFGDTVESLYAVITGVPVGKARETHALHIIKVRWLLREVQDDDPQDIRKSIALNPKKGNGVHVAEEIAMFSDMSLAHCLEEGTLCLRRMLSMFYRLSEYRLGEAQRQMEQATAAHEKVFARLRVLGLS